MLRSLYIQNYALIEKLDISFSRDVYKRQPDALSLSAYIEAVESGDVLDGTPVYAEGIGSLSPIYNFVMMLDMEMMLSQPETYVRLIPNFFFRPVSYTHLG